MSRTRMSRATSPWLAAAAYLAITIAMTWPLARGLARDVPVHLGDPLLNMWILSWDAEQLKAILGGDLSRVTTFFDANIFHPERRTLAYSEHLFAQALQVFPVYLASGNPILGYNLLFLSTFVLCGLGTFLLVRELSGSTPAAFLAGLLFAFAPYRFAQAGHLQVLSVQWMPLALYGFRRYFETHRRRALAGAAAAVLAQNLSCGYYLLYFAPLAGVYVVWEIATRRLVRDARIWRDLIVAGATIVACTLPFVLPYKHVRDSLDLARDLPEVSRYSADVYSYFTAFPSSRIWGSTVRALPGSERELFPGFVPLVLALAGALAWVATALRARSAARSTAVGTLLAVAAAAYGALAVWVAATRGVRVDVGVFEVRATNAARLLMFSALAAAAALWASPGARCRAAAALRQPTAVFLMMLVLAWWLSLGPSPRINGRPLELWSPYAFLFEHVPGYDGLRVPSRFAMIVALALAVLGGVAVARLPRFSRPASGVLALAFLIEATTVPLALNVPWEIPGSATPEGRVYPPNAAPAIYGDMAREHAHAVLLEMPVGQPSYDVRAVYYSTVHWRRLVNGYSGFFPPHYDRLIALLATPWRDDDQAWHALEGIGVTHVLVHEGAYLNDEGASISAWLRDRGAAEVSHRGRDWLFELPH